MTDALPPANTPAGAPVTASPLATGDYGGRYQDAVDGWFLSHLLMGTSVAGVPGTLTRVGFQRRAHGAFLDDTVIEMSGGSTVEFSTKAGIKLGASDPELRETLTLAWARAQGPAEQRSGLVAPPSATGIGIFAHLLFLATNTTSSPISCARFQDRTSSLPRINGASRRAGRFSTT